MRFSITLFLVLAFTHSICSAATPSPVDFELPASGTVMVPAKGGVEFDALLNGQGPFRLIFDSGASANALSPAVAKQLGLRTEGPVIQATGAGSGSIATQAANVAQVRIGDLVLHDQTFLIVPLPWQDRPGPVGEVSYEMMKRLIVTVDYEHEQLGFTSPLAFSHSGKGVMVPIEPAPSQIEVRASIDGANGVFLIDTGDEASLTLEQRFVAQHNLVKKMSPRYHGYSGSGVGGPEPAAYYGRVKTLRIGEAEVNNVIAFLCDGQAISPENAGNIGTLILRQFNITFDVPHGVLYFEKNSNWGKPEVFNRAGIVVDSIQQDQKVMTILPGSPAEIAGVAVGDIIMAIDGRAPNDNPLQRDDPAFLQPVGTVVRLTIQHGDKIRTIDLTLRDLL
jgi:predicted aspartyl protease